MPLYFTVVTALKTPAEAGSFSPPSSWQGGNFAAASAKVDYPRAALNSAIITVIAVSLTLVTNTFVAYAIARNMDKRFFRFLYYFFIAAMFVPFPVVMLPLAKQMGSWHLDNQAGLIILYVILGLGTNLFIATGFIRSIPVSLEEAARIDGAGTWRIFWRIIFPLMGPINATIAIMTALWAWNDSSRTSTTRRSRSRSMCSARSLPRTTRRPSRATSWPWPRCSSSTSSPRSGSSAV